MPKGILFGLAAALSFSLMALFVKLSLGIPTQEIIFARSLFTLIASLLVIYSKKISPWGKVGNQSFLIIRGCAGYLALSAYFFSITKLPIGVASLIQYLSPIFSATFAYFLLKEGSSGRQIISLLMGLLGIAFVSELSISGPNLNQQSLIAPPIYFLACVTSAILSGVAYSAVRKLNLQGENSDVIIFYFPLISLPLSLLASVPVWVWPSLKQSIFIFLACALSYAGQQFLINSGRHKHFVHWCFFCCPLGVFVFE
jgi:drug/metabolite transporter (DMT)-like permease